PKLRAASRRWGAVSVAKIRAAPVALAIAIAISPIGPQPVTRTVRAESGVENAVCTALPNGSCAAAIAGGRSVDVNHALYASMATYSAKQPGRSTPRIFTF